MTSGVDHDLPLRSPETRQRTTTTSCQGGMSDGKQLRIGLSLQGLLARGLVVDHVFDDALVDRSLVGSDLIVTPSDATLSGTWSRVDCKMLVLP